MATESTQPTHRRSPALLAATIVLWLGIGAAITVGVAWAGAVWMAFEMRDRWDVALRALSNRRLPPLIGEDLASRAVWPSPPGPGFADRPDWVHASRGAACSWTLVMGGRHSGGDDAQPRRIASVQQQTLSSFGAPLYSMHWWEWTIYSNRTFSRDRSVRIQTPWLIARSEPLALPLSPLWPGFAIDTLFFAACAWGLWQIPLAIRRRSRRRRGLCPRCAYSLAGLTPGAACPECGPSGGRAGVAPISL